MKRAILCMVLLLSLMTVLYGCKTAEKEEKSKGSTIKHIMEDEDEGAVKTDNNEGESRPDEVSEDKNSTKKQEFLAKAKKIEKYESKVAQEAMSQADINVSSEEVYKRWDALLNEVYNYLKETMTEEEFASLQEDEIKWIAEKEAAIEAAGKEWEGGTGEPMARNATGSEYTSERVYHLISLID